MIKGSASKTSLRGSTRIETKAKECLDLETIQDDLGWRPKRRRFQVKPSKIKVKNLLQVHRA